MMLRVVATIDSNDFRLLFDQWHRKVYHYALSKTKSEFIAEETVQRVFIKLWNNLNKDNQHISIQAQLFCITKTVMIDILRQENRRTSRQHEASELSIDTDTPLEVYQLKELQQQLSVYIDTMPPIRQQVFKMSRYEQLSYHEIADKLDIKTKTVENHINLALKYLKKLMHQSNRHLLIIFIFFWG